MSSQSTSARADSLHRRLKKLKSRVLIHRWELRQRDYSKGSWFRLRRALSSADEAYSIPAPAAEELESQGLKQLPVGSEFDPPLKMYWVSRLALEQISGHRRLALRLDAAFLRAGAIALVPFDDSKNPENPGK